MGKMFLLIVDAHTKWMDIHITNSSTSQVTIEKLCQSVSNFGFPLMIVTDNGSSFVSEEFQTFLAANGIIHRRSSPYHPATNGLAERAVKTFKHSMRKLFDFSQNFRTFQPGDDVLFRNFGAKYPKWISGVIQNQTGSLSYSVILADGHCVRRHVDHIISRVPDTNKSDFDDVPSPPILELFHSQAPHPLSLLPRTDIHHADRYSPSRN